VVGLLTGFGFAFAFRGLINTAWFPADLPSRTLVATPRTVVAALLVGCVVTLLSAHAPARRASRVSPLAALRDDPASPRLGGKAWTLAGSVVASAALAVLLFAALTYTGPLLFLGGALALVGMRMLGPRLVPVLASVVGPPLARGLPLSGALGRQNAIRNPERSSATASALMIGLALATFVTVLGASTKAYIVAQLDRYQVDFELRMDQPNGEGKSAPQRMSTDLLRCLTVLPQLGAVVPVTGTGDATVAGEQAGVEAVDPGGLARVLDVDVGEGSLAALAGDGIGVSADAAAAHGWGVGSHIPVELPGGTRTLTVQVVYGTNDDSYAPYTPPRFLVTPTEFVRLGGDPAPYTVLVRAANGVPLGTAEAAIRRAVAPYPGVTVHAGSERAQHDLDMIERMMRVYLTLTGLAIMVGLFGIVNVLALSVVERRRELGLLRAVGMDRRQVRSMVRAEAVIIAIVGALLGIGLGTFLAWAAGRVFERSSSPTLFTLPVVTLAVYAMAAGIAGVVAAVLPARWASRMDVVAAITTE
jgi:putative ABC transport system permease protein